MATEILDIEQSPVGDLVDGHAYLLEPGMDFALEGRGKQAVRGLVELRVLAEAHDPAVRPQGGAEVAAVLEQAVLGDRENLLARYSEADTVEYRKVIVVKDDVDELVRKREEALLRDGAGRGRVCEEFCQFRPEYMKLALDGSESSGECSQRIGYGQAANEKRLFCHKNQSKLVAAVRILELHPTEVEAAMGIEC